MPFFPKLLSLLLTVILVSSCASSLEGDTYSRDDARKSMAVQEGTVTAVRPVVIEGDRTAAGNLSGAVIGGVSGNAVGGGSGRNIATAVGVVAGSIIGQMAEERITRAQGVELLILLDSGETIAIVQQAEETNPFATGDRVRIITGNGTTRISK